MVLHFSVHIVQLILQQTGQRLKILLLALVEVEEQPTQVFRRHDADFGVVQEVLLDEVTCMQEIDGFRASSSHGYLVSEASGSVAGVEVTDFGNGYHRLGFGDDHR